MIHKFVRENKLSQIVKRRVFQIFKYMYTAMVIQKLTFWIVLPTLV